MESPYPNVDIVSAAEAAALLDCSRSNVERLQLKGDLIPAPTIHPRYYFKRSDVLELKEKLTSKSINQ